MTPLNPLLPFQFSNFWSVILYRKFSLLNKWYGFCYLTRSQLIEPKVASLLLTLDLVLVLHLFHAFPSSQMDSYPFLILQDLTLVMCP